MPKFKVTDEAAQKTLWLKFLMGAGNMKLDDAMKQKLWTQFWSGNEQEKKQARESLIESYMPFAKKITERQARRTPTNLCSYDDLLQVVLIAMNEAIEKWCPQEGLQFTSYCGTRLNGAMLDYLRSLDWCPRSVRHTITRIGRLKAEGKDQEQIAAEVNVPRHEVSILERDTAGFLNDLLVTRNKVVDGECVTVDSLDHLDEMPRASEIIPAISLLKMPSQRGTALTPRDLRSKNKLLNLVKRNRVKFRRQPAADNA